MLAHDPYANRAAAQEAGVELVELDRLLAESAAISLARPGHRRHQASGEPGVPAEACAPGAILVNTSRGALVDEDALADALASGQLAAAALDVFDPEPLSPTSPLRELDNVLFTPHAAFFSDDSIEALQRMATEEAARALAGEPLRSRVV